MSNVFVFRIANNDFVKSEIGKGRLRQGWGNSTSDLTDTTLEKWVKSKSDAKPFEDDYRYYASKYKNLVKMLEIKAGDILIIPKVPDYNTFTVCQASDGYTFTKPEGFDGDDYYHTISIDTASIRNFSYYANEKSKIIHAKFRAYQSPVNKVWNEDVVQAVNRLIEIDSVTSELSTIDIVKEIKDDIFKTSAIDRFRNLGNHETEKMVKLIFEKLGYEFIGSNSYDREGGDADLIFADNSFGELMDAGINSSEISGKVFVQVKNKYGTDNNDIAGVKQLIQRTENENAAAKILISTADCFTQECVKLANQNNILLINGKGFLNLLFRYVD